MASSVVANRTVVGLFDDIQSAQRAANELVNAGITRDQISVVAGNESGRYSDYISGSGEIGKNTGSKAGAGAAIGGGLGLLAGLAALAIPGFGPVIAMGPIATALTGAGIGAATGGLIGGLKDSGVPEHHAEYYAEGVRRGGVLVTVRTSDDLADKAADILDAAGAADVDERSAQWRSSGWSPKYATNFDDRTDRTDDRTMKTGRNIEGDRKMDVVQEDIHIGKREVGRRAVRIYSEITEKPVEKTVNLREEKIHVDRQPVNREARPGEIESFKEGQIELTERREEPVVTKTARVVEEVRVGKEVSDRTETVRDTVRRKDVRVEETGTTGDYDADYRNDYQTRYANRGQKYEYYAPAYQFGSTYANDQRYRDRDWSVAESDLRRDWETRGHGKWEDFKDSIRYGWDRVRGRH